MIHMQTTMRIKGMNEHLIVKLPRIEGGRCTLGNESVAFNATASRVVTGENDLASKEIITEPYLILGQEPVRIVSYVKISIAVAW